jgi:hypothetical protein
VLNDGPIISFDAPLFFQRRGYFFSPSFQPPLATLCVCNTPSTTRRRRRRFFNSLFSLKLAGWRER